MCGVHLQVNVTSAQSPIQKTLPNCCLWLKLKLHLNIFYVSKKKNSSGLIFTFATNFCFYTNGKKHILNLIWLCAVGNFLKGDSGNDKNYIEITAVNMKNFEATLKVFFCILSEPAKPFSHPPFHYHSECLCFLRTNTWLEMLNIVIYSLGRCHGCLCFVPFHWDSSRGGNTHSSTPTWGPAQLFCSNPFYLLQSFWSNFITEQFSR